MKKIIRTIRTYLVIAYANRQYKQKVKLAEKLNKKHHTRFYVALHHNGKSLYVISRKGFRDIKRELSYNKDSVLKLKEGSFYYTGNAIGADTIPPWEKEARRLAFIKIILEKSGLLPLPEAE